MVERRRWQTEADRLGNADPSDPTGWFERLWSAAGRGDVAVPWDHDDPHPVLASWLETREPPAAGRSAVVVGCGLGADAEHLSRLGWATTAFDVSPSAVAAARARHPARPWPTPSPTCSTCRPRGPARSTWSSRSTRCRR
ncbi:methyltransferase domain-containing protein [Cellulosimicrobium sp. CUA-896]|uniref:methyltransferase domain-containing protein n=1 Tax=Cellulosimicrobium sp. CUA-896 TaxID=1517881 RepID=UPI002100DC43|nr:methyltransferase domain-containing protein [Cellulosimicrobium sp. CUA-896]